MDCLICYKVFIKEIEFQDCQPKDWASTISKLFQIPQNPDVDGHLEDLAICRGCHRKLENVEKLVTQLEKIQRKVDSAKTQIQNEMVNSNKLCEALARATAANRMSKSSVDRCALLKAIENGGDKTKESAIPQSVVFPFGEIKKEIFEEEVPVTSRMDKEHAIYPNYEVFSAGEIKEEVYEEEVFTTSGMDQEINEKSNEPVQKSSKKSKSKDPLKNPRSTQEDPDFEPGSSSEDTDSSDSELKARIWPHKCPHCSRRFRDKRGITNHLGSETPSECKTCNETFPTSGCLYEHQFLVHRYGVYAKLEASRLKYLAERKKGFQCQLCSRLFGLKSVLIKHLEIHDPPRFVCPEDGCGWRFTREYNMKQHIKAIHKKTPKTSPKKVKGKGIQRSRVGAFKCRISSTCRRVFKSMNSRDFHEEVHKERKVN